MNGKATRDFTNFRQPPIEEEDYLGSRAIIDGRYKLVIHDTKASAVKRELFDLQADEAEKNNLYTEQKELAESLQQKMRAWQLSVLTSLSGADYRK